MKKLFCLKGGKPYSLKVDLKMKLTVLLTIVSLVQIQASTYSQSKKISLDMPNATVQEVIQEIESLSDFKFLLNRKDVDLNRNVSIKVNKKPIANILTELFKGTDIGYEIWNKQIILREMIGKFDSLDKSAVAGTDEISMQFQVSGTVTDTNGTPLPGASIVEKGTTNGVQTDFDGNFSIEIADENATLEISYIGFAKKVVSLNGETTLNVTLEESAASLEEVVVIGYGTSKKSDLTGSVSSISNEDFNTGVNASVDQLMQGRAAGVQINQTSGEPGGGISVRVRGSSSINAGNDPLYVIDGLPIDNSPSVSPGGVAGIGNIENTRNPLNALNPNDIQSIEILKDASATAIYGSRGANGVVLITTKKGKEGKAQITYDSYVGIQTTARRLDVLSTGEYIDVMNGMSIDGGQGPVFSSSDISALGAGIDWQDQVYRSAVVSNYNLSFSGGDENTTYRASLNYFDQNGIVKNTGIKRYITRVNLERKFGENFQMGINVNNSFIKDINGIDNIQTNERAGPIQAAIEYDPTEPIYNPDGTFARSANITVNNPLSVLNGISNETKTNRTFGNIYFQYDLFEDLSAKVNFGYDAEASERDLYNSTATLTGAAANGIANIGTLRRSNVLLEYTMTYNKEFNENHIINVLGGVTFQDFENKSFSGNISGFPTDALLTNNLGLGDTATDDLNSNREENKLLSYIGRVNYNLFNKYLITASIRADGSSRFGENNKFGYFPSFAFAWKLAEEDFVPELFDDLKLRASWGLTGNQEIGNYRYLSTFVPGSNAIISDQVISTISPSRVANPNLKWEATKQLDIGLDASILNGRISATIDYFIKNTQDLLINRPLPRASGYSAVLSNIGKMENKGIEILFNSTNISTENFSWNTSVNFSAQKNKVKDLGGIGDIITGNIEAVGNTALFREGEPLASYYGYEVTGIFQTGDDIAVSPQPNAEPGYPIFRDVNGDNDITPDDRVIIGNPNPDFTYGLQNSFTIKNFQLDFFLQGQQGNDLLNINLLRAIYPTNIRSNRIAEPNLNRWTVDNSDTKWPAGVNSSAYEGGKVNSLVVEDASYLQLKTVTLGYNIPQQLLQSMRVYLTGQNLFTITDYGGVNPESNALGNNNARVDYNAYPLARTFLLGLKIGF